MAGVCRAWKWPQVGTYQASYEVEDAPEYGLITLDFGTWRPDYAGCHDTRITEAAAHLLYGCAVAVETRFSPVIAMCDFDEVARGLRTFLRYSPQLLLLKRRTCTGTMFNDSIMADLSSGVPVIMKGTGNVGGHIWAVDQVRADGKVRVDWGWGGAYNGWYSLGAMAPGGMTFKSAQEAIVGIVP